MGSIIKALFSNIAKVVTGKFMSSDNLKALLQKLKPKFDELQSDINDVAGDVSTLSSTVGGHTTKIGALETTVETHTSDISGLKTKDTTLQNAIDAVEGDVSTLSSTVSGHTSDINSLESAVDEHTSDIQNLEIGKTAVNYSYNGVAYGTQHAISLTSYDHRFPVTEYPIRVQLSNTSTSPTDDSQVYYVETSTDQVYIFNQNGQAPIKLDSLLDDLGNIVGSCAFFSKDVSNAINALSDYLPSIN